MIVGGTGVFEIYYKIGSYVGSESNAAAWIFIGSASVTSLGFDLATPIPVPINIFLPAGQTYGFYITENNPANSAGVRYTNNAGYATLATDATITIGGGIGKSYPFGTNFNNRSPNITVHYSATLPLPIDLLNFSANITPENYIKLDWTTLAEIDNDYFSVERSKNIENQEWEEITKVLSDKTNSPSSPLNYHTYDKNPYQGIAYYRLKQTDFNGDFTYSKIISVNNNKSQKVEITIYPNPTNSLFTIKGNNLTNLSVENIDIFNMLGQSVKKVVKIDTKEAQSLIVSLEDVPMGFYTLKIFDNTFKILKQ
jgi:hypothetical protein